MNLFENFQNALSKEFTTPIGDTLPISGEGLKDYTKILKRYNSLIEIDEEENKEATSSGSAGGYSTKLFASEGNDQNELDGLAKNMTIKDLAKKHKVKIQDIQNQVKKGIEVEKEHTKSKKIAKKIAMDHIYEDPKYYDKLKKVETKEATSTSSSGSYESPAAWAKSTKKKDWRGASKPIYSGGKFVKVKNKCKTYPYCNQGDINSLELFENKTLNKVIRKLSKKYNIGETIIKSVILDKINKLNG